MNQEIFKMYGKLASHAGIKALTKKLELDKHEVTCLIYSLIEHDYDEYITIEDVEHFYLTEFC